MTTPKLQHLQFSQVVIMPKELYTSTAEEMVPVNFTPLEICDIPSKEDDGAYRRRIENIIDLRKSRVFDVENVVFRIQQELFEQVVFQGSLHDEQEQRYGM